VLGLCRGLQAAGLDVEVVTTTANGEGELPPSPPDGDTYHGIRVHYAPRTFPRRFFAAATRGALMDALGRSDICHIHGMFNFTAWDAARCAARARVPFLVSPRGMLQPAALRHHRWRKRMAWRWFDRPSLEAAARVHATAPEEAATLARIVDPSRVVTVPNGVDVDAADRAAPGIRARLRLPEGVPLVVALGRLHPIKRLDLLAAAVGRALAAHPDLRLVIAGPNEGDHLNALAPHLAPLRDAARYVGPLDASDKWALLRAAAVVVSCSDSESFGMSTLEAMAAGRPVVVTQTCPWSEVAHERAGLWVPQDTASIADAISSIVSDPVAAASMGAAGARLARQRYGWRAVAEQMATCYADALATR
jgi:glycosyltransferase involved in cell wall biosynthesis